MSDATRLQRPVTPPGHDPSRAAQRAADPRGWRYDHDALETVHRVIAERRDIRRFRPDPVPDAVLERVLAAAHRAPSVGLMQPWRLIVVRDVAPRVAIRDVAARERLRQAGRFDERARQFLDQKIEGIVEAPVGVCVCCHHGRPGEEILGRGTIPETDVYSTACAIQNLWLAARAEGLGVGWVSFYRLADLRAILGIPARVDPIAYLCVGWPDERPVRPGLESSGWASRLPLERVVMAERWRDEPGLGDDDPARDDVADAPREPDRAAAIAARDRSDRLVKPGGSLGALEALVERWAATSGAPPPPRIRAGVLVCAADHGHTAHGTSLFGSRVSAQVAAAAARGETAVGVLARDGGHRLLVADVGLRGPTPEGVDGRKVAGGSADMTAGAGLTADQLDTALDTGRELAAQLAGDGVDCAVLGEIGIGNTATAAALASLLTGAPASDTVGRGRRGRRSDRRAARGRGDPGRDARRDGRDRARGARRRGPRGVGAPPAGRARRLRDGGRRAGRRTHAAGRRHRPLREPSVGRARPPPRPHGARPRAAARPAHAPRRGVRRAPRAAAHRARRPAARADGDVRRSARRRPRRLR